MKLRHTGNYFLLNMKGNDRSSEWPIKIPQFLARKLKHHPESELGALKAEFGPLPVGKPN
jgi:hypothetical protein